MGMTHAEMDRVIDQHFQFEATDDIDGVMASYADGPVVHEAVPSRFGRLTDRAKMREFYELVFSCARGDKATSIRRLYGDDFIVDETQWEGEQFDGKPFLLDGKGGHMSIRILHIFTFRDGKIASETVWLDHAAMARQLS
jgi:ketosteroid isomerase-like protein